MPLSDDNEIGATSGDWELIQDHREEVPIWARSLAKGKTVDSETEKEYSKGSFIRKGLYLEGSEELEESDWQYGPEKMKRMSDKNTEGKEERNPCRC